MGLLDWFRPRTPPRSVNAIARDLAAAVFALHPAALDQVVLTLRRGVVVAMEVPGLDPARDGNSRVDPALQTARISQLAAELARSGPRTHDPEVTVMRDRVIWMPSVVTSPPLP